MFSGIIEAKSRVTEVSKGSDLIRVGLVKPEDFNDLKIGQSICVNGVCLTLEEIKSKTLHFAIGIETLKITGWNEFNICNLEMNLERSLKWGDRVDGHFVTGHVDAKGTVVEVKNEGENFLVFVKVPSSYKKYFWKKGSLCINGVSLTINSFDNEVVSCCLIPQTIKETNLGKLKAGDGVNLEVDYMIRGLVHAEASVSAASAIKENTEVFQ